MTEFGLTILYKDAVWRKAKPVPDALPSVEREDDYGTRIRYSNYGDRTSPWGWEMDHYPVPRSLGGSDDLSNLRPLHHRTNASHGGFLGGLLGLGR